jgi:hypothetical protein
MGQFISHLAWVESSVFKKFPAVQVKHASSAVLVQVSHGNVHSMHDEDAADKVYPRGHESKQYELLITNG